MRPSWERSPLQRGRWWIAITALLLLITPAFARSPPVTATLQAPWTAPPLVLEAIEFISQEPGVDLFSFISDLPANTTLQSRQPRQETYSTLLSLVSNTPSINPSSIPLLKLSLSVHSNAPRVHAYHQLYEETVVREFSSRHGTTFDPTCDVWVDWYGVQACTVEKLDILVASDHGSASKRSSVQLLPFDHVYDPVPVEDAHIAILYANIFSPSFPAFHKRLMELAKKTGLSYVLRFKPSSSEELEILQLSGYAVELAVKSTEYKVIDDRDLQKDNGDADSSIIAADKILREGDILHEDTPVLKKLDKEAISVLGFQTAQYILDAENPLAAFGRVTQDFPKYAHILSNITMNRTLADEFAATPMLRQGLWLNGWEQDMERIDIFGLLRNLRSEIDLVNHLSGLGFNTEQAISLLSTPLQDSGSKETGWGTGFDVRSSAVVFWNDLEKDTRYKRFPKSLKDLLRPPYPGQLKYVAKNIFHVVWLLDLSNKVHLRSMQTMLALIEQSVPLRMGFAPLFDEADPDAASTLAARAVYKLIETGGRKDARRFLTEARLLMTVDVVDASVVKNAFEKVRGEPLAATDAEEQVKESLALMDRLGARLDENVFFLNGKRLEMDGSWQQSMLSVYFQMLEYLLQPIYTGTIDDTVNVYDYFMELPNVYHRRNPLIFTSDANPAKIVDLVRARSGSNIHHLPWLSNAVDTHYEASLVIAADLDSQSGLQLLLNGIEYTQSLSEGSKTRICSLHNPSKRGKKTSRSVGLHIEETQYALALKGGADALVEFASAVRAALADGKVDKASVSVDGKVALEKFQSDAAAFVVDALGLKGGEFAVLYNARLLKLSTGDKAAVLSKDDFRLLGDVEVKERFGGIGQKVLEYGSSLNGIEVNTAWLSRTILDVATLVAVNTNEAATGAASLYSGEKPERLSSATFESWVAGRRMITAGNKETAIIRFTGLINPATPVAQKIAALLNVMSRLDGVYVEVLLAPVALEEENIPVQRFYRYVLHEELRFDEQGEIVQPVASFHDVPVEPLLTLGMDVPGAWVVFPTQSVQDLDNIRLSSLRGDARRNGVEAFFALKNILVEGHARDSATNGPPRGLQFILGTPSSPSLVDTITMANLGYLQLKANPGVWELRLREGRSREVYDIEAVGDSYGRSSSQSGDNLIGDEGARIVVNSFEGVTIFPIVGKRKGMEKVDVLGEEEEKDAGKPSGVWNKIKGSLFKHSQKNVSDTVNVFSVASGHLYERFLSIMMLSVKKNTKSKVKFWLIENFLSPSFKEFIPHLANEHDFEYELVTYKWPTWLRYQSEKQRLIWGYKILFLDVLFPLSLDKVIFVDADQVVRADLKELVDMDLQGAVYGYTPFCDDRKEMDGFRFWKSGYWQTHLAGLPYHISALYVVDLSRFRKVAAGDRLRHQYQMLSADPGSLANLDQDLPNNMIHTLPIFSLPQEWLWCETWCSDESLKNAKTIDLCNNPLTKEPKLERARRILPEWAGLDEEVQKVREKVAGKVPVREGASSKQTTRSTQSAEKDEL